jgi:hypothetical protein
MQNFGRACAKRLGSARVSRAGFGVAPKQSFPGLALSVTISEFGEKFAIARTRSPTRETCALPDQSAAQRQLFAGTALQRSACVFAI